MSLLDQIFKHKIPFEKRIWYTASNTSHSKCGLFDIQNTAKYLYFQNKIRHPYSF